MRRVRPAFAAVAAAAAITLSLVGCTPDPAPESTADPAATDAPITACSPSGTQSEAITVTGDYDTAPTVDFEFPVSTDVTQRTIVTEGDGDETAAGDEVNTHFSIYSATSGELLTSTGYTTDLIAPITLDDTTLPGFVKSILCSPIGSRVVSVIPPADAFGETGFQSDQFSVAADESLVFVIDILSIVEPLTATEWTDDVPDVEFDGDGVPTVTLPTTGTPTELLLAVLDEGDGDVVKAGDDVSVNYQGTSWNTGEIFDESYTTGPREFNTNGVIEGFTAALVGQKVGSTVIVSIPPQYAYGVDPDAHELGGQTLLFVMTIEDIV